MTSRDCCRRCRAAADGPGGAGQRREDGCRAAGRPPATLRGVLRTVRRSSRTAGGRAQAVQVSGSGVDGFVGHRVRRGRTSRCART